MKLMTPRAFLSAPWSRFSKQTLFNCPVFILFFAFNIFIQQAHTEVAAKEPAQLDLLNQIMDSWDKRAEAIKSFQYDCEVKELRTAPRKEYADAFGQKAASTKFTFEKVIKTPETRFYLTFCMDNGRFARISDGSRWHSDNETIEDFTFEAKFNGSEYRTLLIGRNKHEMTDKTTVLGDQLLKNTQVIPFWLSYSPKRILKELGYDLKSVKVGPKRVMYKGKECIALKFKRGHFDWIGYVFVDPLTDHLPVRFIAFYDEKIKSNYHLEYHKDDEDWWVLKAWQYSYNDDPSPLKRTLKCEVKSSSINEPLEDNVF